MSFNIPAASVNVTGLFTATVKSFLINHPTQPGKQLQYGVLEGPEHAVYYRGRNTTNNIDLPEEWTKLVDHSTITVQLTPIGIYQNMYVKDIIYNKIIIQTTENIPLDYYFLIHGERTDIAKLKTVI
jgi:hypothetical protein